MNTERIRELATVLRTSVKDETFDLCHTIVNYNGLRADTVGELVHRCGTVACIAGFAVIHFDPNYPTDLPVMKHARKLLDLGEDTAMRLFDPITFDIRVDYTMVTPAIAADVCDHLADTGKVVWPKEVLIQ